MEIIEPGQIPEEEVFTGQCTRCRCKVRFKRSEAKYRSSPRNETFLTVKCPTAKCGNEIWVEI